MAEANICQYPPQTALHTSTLDIYTVFEPLLCRLNGLWEHPHTITPAKLAPDLEIQDHLMSENDVTAKLMS